MNPNPNLDDDAATSDRLIELIIDSKHHHPSSSGEKEIRKEVEKLLKERNNREYINKLDTISGMTPLMYACRRLMLGVVRLLIEAGADPNIADRESNATALMHTVEQIGNRDLILSIVAYLLKHGANPNAADSHGRTPIMMTASARIAYELAQSGACLDAKDAHGLTALMRAVQFRNYDLVSVLIDQGANIYERDLDGKCALDYLDQFFTPRDFKLFVISKYLESLYVYFKNDNEASIQLVLSKLDEKIFPFKQCHLTAMKHLIIEIDEMNSKQSIVNRDFILGQFHFLPYFASSDFKQKLFSFLLNLMGKSDLEAFLDDRNNDLSTNESLKTKENVVLIRDFYDSFVIAAERIFAEINRALIDAEYPDEFKQLLVDYLKKFENFNNDPQFFIQSTIC